MSFFGFDTSVPKAAAPDNSGLENTEDFHNDETFGTYNEEDDWEMSHEKLASIHEEFLKGSTDKAPVAPTATTTTTTTVTATTVTSASTSTVPASSSLSSNTDFSKSFASNLMNAAPSISVPWSATDVDLSNSVSRLLLDSGLDYGTTKQTSTTSSFQNTYGGTAVWGESIWSSPAKPQAVKTQHKILSVADLEQQQQQQPQQSSLNIKSVAELEKQLLENTDSAAATNSTVQQIFAQHQLQQQQQQGPLPAGLPNPYYGGNPWAGPPPGFANNSNNTAGFVGPPPGMPLLPNPQFMSMQAFPPLGSSSPYPVQPPSLDNSLISVDDSSEAANSNNNNSSNNNNTNNNNNNNNGRGRPPRKYHLMSRSDKEFVIRVQLSALQTDNPYVDDFYYQAHLLRKSRDDAVLRLILPPVNNPNPVPTQQDQQKKIAQIFENSLGLGKIPVSSVHYPRHLINVQAPDTDKSENSEEKVISRRRQLLKLIEGTYQQLIEIEDLDKKSASMSIQDKQSLYSQRAAILSQIFANMQLKGANEEVNDTGFLEFISIPKGLKLIRRVIPLFTEDQSFSVVQAILRNVELISVGKIAGSAVDPAEIISLSMSHIVPPVVRATELFPLYLIEKCMSVFVANLGPHNAVQTVGSRFGMTVLYAFLRRVDYLLSSTASKDEEQWAALWDKFFTALKGSFTEIVNVCINNGTLWVFAMMSVLAKLAPPSHLSQLKVELEPVMSTLPEAISGTPATRTLIQLLKK